MSICLKPKGRGYIKTCFHVSRPVFCRAKPIGNWVHLLGEKAMANTVLMYAHSCPCDLVSEVLVCSFATPVVKSARIAAEEAAWMVRSAFTLRGETLQPS